MQKQKIGILILMMMLLSVGMVSATHTATGDLVPKWSPASTAVDYTVTICNEAGSDNIDEVRIIKNPLYEDITCDPVPGWETIYVDTWNEPDVGAVPPDFTEMCWYYTIDPINNIEDDSCLDFSFTATTPAEEDCNLPWKFETRDQESSTSGDWNSIFVDTGVDSTDPEFVKTVIGPNQATDGVIGDLCPNGPADDEYCHISELETITVVVTDPGDADCIGTNVVPSGMDYCQVQVLVDGVVDPAYNQIIYDDDVDELNDDGDNEITFEVEFNEETEHELQFTCYDVAGNTVEDAEMFRVDDEEPTTTIDLEAGVEYEAHGESQWLDTNSAISISAIDNPDEKNYMCAIGVDETYYREFYFGPGEDWSPCESTDACNAFDGGPSEPCITHVCTYTPFVPYEGGLLNPGAESCHVIEAYSVDEFGHEETPVRECYFVDKTPPVTTMDVGDVNVFWDEIVDAADRVLALQADDGSWDWVVTDATGPTGTTYLNIAGITADVLLDAYYTTGDVKYLEAAVDAGDYLVAQIGTPSSSQRQNAFNILFLYDLADATGDTQYSDLALALVTHTLSEENYWSLNNGNHCADDATAGCTATELLDALKDYRSWSTDPSGIVVWDLHTYVQAAEAAGEHAFAVALAAEIDAYLSTGYDDTAEYYELGLAAGVLSLEAAGMDSSDYVTLLLAAQNVDGSFAGEIQTTAYAVMALEEVDEMGAAEAAAMYLVDNFGYSTFDGWLENDAKEYSEVTSEAAQALAAVAENGFFVRLATQVDLTCVDPEPHPSGREVLSWTVSRSENGVDWTVESSGVEAPGVQAKTVGFLQTSLHKIEWSCEDAVGKKSPDFVNYFKVDEDAPIITKEVTGTHEGQCPPADGFVPASMDDPDACFLKGTDASVVVSVADEQSIHMTNNVQCEYDVEWKGKTIDEGTFGEEGKTFTWDEDSEHILTITCWDAVGNTATDVEHFLVDITPPVTTKTYDETKSVVKDGYRWILDDTLIEMDATDAKVGVDHIEYRVTLLGDDLCPEVCDEVGNGDWTTVAGDHAEFVIPEESCHYIEFFAIDRLGNTEFTNSQCVMVDDSAPEMDKVVGEPQVIKGGSCEVVEDAQDAPAVAPGTNLRQISGAYSQSCNTNTGLAFDGTNLLISCWDHNVIDVLSPADGSLVGTITVPGYSGLYANAWDATRGMLWQCAERTHVLLVDTSDGSSTLMFDAPGSCTDGLAYDGTDDTIWTSGDTENAIYHYETDGTLIETLDMSGKIGSCGNSGIAVGGTHLYLANDGCSEIYEATKDLSSSTLFAAFPRRLEDMECDDLTFAAQGVGAIWSQDAYDRIINAYAIPQGQCGFGGLPPVCEDSDLYITQQTPLTLSCWDADPHPVGDVTLEYRYRTARTCEELDEMIANDEDEWTDWMSASDDVRVDEIYSFPEDSCHQLEYRCTDGLGIMSDSLFEIDIVDTAAPEITTGIEGPTHTIGNDVFVDGVTNITVDATDVMPHPVGDVMCEWSYDVIGNNKIGLPGENTPMAPPFKINFPEESQHMLHIECWDALGNTAVLEKTYLVDKTPPGIWKNYDWLFSDTYEDEVGTYWAKFTRVDAPIFAGVTDEGPHKSGIADVKYKISMAEDDDCKYYLPEVDDVAPQAAAFVNDVQYAPNYDFDCDEASESGDWITVPAEDFDEFEFSVDEQSCHMIEIMATDNVNKCALHKQYVYVDATAPDTAKVIGEPKAPMSDGNVELGQVYFPEMTADFCANSAETEKCMDVTLLTSVNLACNDPAPHPSGAVAIYFQVDFDGDDLTEQYCEQINESQGWQAVYNETGHEGYCYAPLGASTFRFTEESWHKLTYYCEDNVGNVGVPDVEYFKVEGTAFNISLNKKWNLISVPVKLQDDSMDDVFGDQPGIVSVWGYDGSAWSVYSPDGNSGNDNLHTMVPGRGYWVLTTEPSTLVIGGSLLSPQVTPPDMEIVHGWNLIGYYGVEGAPINEDDVPFYAGPNNMYGMPAYCALATLRDNVWDANTPSLWTYWEPENPHQWYGLDQDDYMNAGAGYWLFYSDAMGGIYAPATSCGLMYN